MTVLNLSYFDLCCSAKLTSLNNILLLEKILFWGELCLFSLRQRNMKTFLIDLRKVQSFKHIIKTKFTIWCCHTCGFCVHTCIQWSDHAAFWNKLKSVLSCLPFYTVVLSFALDILVRRLYKLGFNCLTRWSIINNANLCTTFSIPW